MDPHFGDSRPTDEERAAVDPPLGPPASVWEGAGDRSDADFRRVRGGREARDRGVGSYLTPHMQDNEIVKVTSPHDNPVTHGNLCIKGRFGHQHVQNRD